jgi:serine/threonine-protein kinase RsbW
LPPDPTTVGLVRAVAADVLNRLKVPSRCIDDIRLVLSEACTNAIQHADSDDGYEVRLVVDEGTCTIEVHDAGRQFDLTRRDRQMAPVDARRGRGLAIMDDLTDEMDFTSDPVTGNTVRLAKHLVSRV